MNYIKNKQININSEIELVEWKCNLTNLCNFIEINKKTPIESTELGNWLKGLKRDYSNKEGSVYNDITKRNLWENSIEKYNDIINSHNSAKNKNNIC